MADYVNHTMIPDLKDLVTLQLHDPSLQLHVLDTLQLHAALITSCSCTIAPSLHDVRLEPLTAARFSQPHHDTGPQGPGDPSLHLDAVTSTRSK